ncbi:MAG: carbonic anhydrase [Thermoleophilaceae bacterium]
MEVVAAEELDLDVRLRGGHGREDKQRKKGEETQSNGAHARTFPKFASCNAPFLTTVTRVMIFKSLLIPPVLALAFAAPAMAQQIEWDYEGERGPANWGSLDPSFSTCSTGLSQSPIDLSGADSVRAERIRASYRPTPLVVENNGYTVEGIPDEEQTLYIGDKAFRLLQFHFHAPSEHAVTGRRYPLEIHFVHQAADGERAVFGVLVKRGDRNEAFAELGRLPRSEGDETEVEEPGDLRGLMPRRLTAFRYAGSLTTPPCSEGIRWNVADSYVEMSRRQIDSMSSILGYSARPLQPRNGRALIVG